MLAVCKVLSWLSRSYRNVCGNAGYGYWASFAEQAVKPINVLGDYVVRLCLSRCHALQPAAWISVSFCNWQGMQLLKAEELSCPSMFCFKIRMLCVQWSCWGYFRYLCVVEKQVRAGMQVKAPWLKIDRRWFECAFSVGLVFFVWVFFLVLGCLCEFCY